MSPVRRVVALLVLAVTAGCGSGGARATGPTPRRPSTVVTRATTSTSPTAPGVPPTAASTTTFGASTGETTGPVTITRVVDGDTVHVSNGDTLRLIGMDTPELVDPRKVVQCFAREASSRAHQLLDRATVQLEYDASQGRVDRYGRTLAYLWMADGRLYNFVMIAEGYAHEYTYRIPYRYQELFRAGERHAREAGLGLWSPTSCNGDTSRPAVAPTTGTVPTGCDPSYPTVCIPPPPPDLDCAQIPYRRFAVVGRDPHRFDTDHDGIGCES